MGQLNHAVVQGAVWCTPSHPMRFVEDVYNAGGGVRCSFLHPAPLGPWSVAPLPAGLCAPSDLAGLLAGAPLARGVASNRLGRLEVA